MNIVELYKLLNIIISLAPDAAEAVKRAVEGWGKATGTPVDLSQLKHVPKDKHLQVDADIDTEIERLFK